MPRTARIVAPGVPHHITQRGNRRQPVFFEEGDYDLYRRLMAEWCTESGVEVWAYCLMTNHIHLIAVPEKLGSLARMMTILPRLSTSTVVRAGLWVMRSSPILWHRH